MAKIASIVVCLVLLAGCENSNSLDGQVEKCVQAGIKASEPSNENEMRAAELHWRIHCLRAASGKS